MKNKILYIPILALLMFSACTKVVNINLNTANKQLVIDGQVSDRPGIPDTVKLSETISFFASNSYPTISGARVVISDNTGISDTLKELLPAMPGTYITSPLRLQGTPGRTYTLSVYTKAINAAGQNYTASSTMPDSTKIDSLGQTESLRMRFRPGGNPLDTTYNVTVHWRAPSSMAYYRLNLYYDDTMLNGNGINIINNKYSEGLEMDVLYRGHAFKPGDTAQVELWCIDQNTYNYYNMLNSIINGNNGTSSENPTNPLSNVSTGAVGYFSAYSVTSLTYKIK